MDLVGFPRNSSISSRTIWIIICFSHSVNGRDIVIKEYPKRHFGNLFDSISVCSVWKKRKELIYVLNPYNMVNLVIENRDDKEVGVGGGTLILFLSQLYNLFSSSSQTRVRACWWVSISVYNKKRINPSPYVPTWICIFVWIGRMIFPKPTTLHQSTKSSMNKFTIFMPIHFYEKKQKNTTKISRDFNGLQKENIGKKMNRFEIDRFTLGAIWDVSWLSNHNSN